MEEEEDTRDTREGGGGDGRWGGKGRCGIENLHDIELLIHKQTNHPVKDGTDDLRRKNLPLCFLTDVQCSYKSTPDDGVGGGGEGGGFKYAQIQY